MDTKSRLNKLTTKEMTISMIEALDNETLCSFVNKEMFIRQNALHRGNHDVLTSSRWRHNGRDGVSNHQPHHCLLNSLFGRSKKTSTFRVTGLCAGNSPGNSAWTSGWTRQTSYWPHNRIVGVSRLTSRRSCDVNATVYDFVTIFVWDVEISVY